MLATHDLPRTGYGDADPEDLASSAGHELYTISAGGYSATADAFARDEATEGLWFVSMVGSQTALKAIWASLLKQRGEAAHIIRGADGMVSQRRVPAVRHSLRDSSGRGRPRSPACPCPADGTRWCIRSRRSSDSRRTPSSCWRSRRRRPPRCTTASSTSAARFPCTARGPAWLWERGIQQRGDSPPAIGRHIRLQVLPEGQESPRGPVRRRCVGQADAAHGGVRWIGR